MANRAKQKRIEAQTIEVDLDPEDEVSIGTRQTFARAGYRVVRVRATLHRAGLDTSGRMVRCIED